MKKPFQRFVVVVVVAEFLCRNFCLPPKQYRLHVAQQWSGTEIKVKQHTNMSFFYSLEKWKSQNNRALKAIFCSYFKCWTMQMGGMTSIECNSCHYEFSSTRLCDYKRNMRCTFLKYSLQCDAHCKYKCSSVLLAISSDF